MTKNKFNEKNVEKTLTTAQKLYDLIIPYVPSGAWSKWIYFIIFAVLILALVLGFDVSELIS